MEVLPEEGGVSGCLLEAVDVSVEAVEEVVRAVFGDSPYLELVEGDRGADVYARVALCGGECFALCNDGAGYFAGGGEQDEVFGGECFCLVDVYCVADFAAEVDQALAYRRAFGYVYGVAGKCCGSECCVAFCVSNKDVAVDVYGCGYVELCLELSGGLE